PSETLAVGSILATASIVHDHGADIGFGCEFATDLCFAVEPPHALLLRLFRHVIFHDISRNDGPAEFRLIDGKEQNRFRRLCESARERANRSGCLRHAFDEENAGHYGPCRKVAGKEWLVHGYVLDADAGIITIHFDNPVDEQKRIAV